MLLVSDLSASRYSQADMPCIPKKNSNKYAERHTDRSEATRFVCHVIVRQDKLLTHGLNLNGRSRLNAFSLIDLIYPFHAQMRIH